MRGSHVEHVPGAAIFEGDPIRSALGVVITGLAQVEHGAFFLPMHEVLARCQGCEPADWARGIVVQVISAGFLEYPNVPRAESIAVSRSIPVAKHNTLVFRVQPVFGGWPAVFVRRGRLGC